MNSSRHSQQPHKSPPPSPTPGARPGPTRHATTQSMFPPNPTQVPEPAVHLSTYLIYPSGLHALCETAQLRYTACASISSHHPSWPGRKNPVVVLGCPVQPRGWSLVKCFSFGATTAPSVMRQVRIHTDCTAAGDIVVFLSPAGVEVVVDMSMWFDVSDRGLCSQRRGQDTSTCGAGTGIWGGDCSRLSSRVSHYRSLSFLSRASS